jgi:hypothetical protein
VFLTISETVASNVNMLYNTNKAEKRASLSQFSYQEMLDFNDKLTDLHNAVHQSLVKADEFFQRKFI